jgi:hypothetical protein
MMNNSFGSSNPFTYVYANTQINQVMAIKESNIVELTSEEIQQLNDLRVKSSELTFQRGQIGIAEDNIKRQLNQLAEGFNELYKVEGDISKALFEKYGKGEINLENGTFIRSGE